jgi:ERCC4-type nuclease
MARTVDDTTADRLKELADAEMAEAKQRLAKRTAAAKSYATAAAKLVEATKTWERIQAETTTAKAKAINDLLDSEMKPVQVAELLGLDQRELRAIRTTTPAADRDRAGDASQGAAPPQPEGEG